MTIKREELDQTIFVTLGFDDHGKVKEVFGASSKQSSALNQLLVDACVAVSIALQYGATPMELSKSMTKQPVLLNETKKEEPASLIGVIIETIMYSEMELKAGVLV